MMLFVLKSQRSSYPVLLWLQGGPGGSSLFGALNENGPFGIDKDLHSKINSLCCCVTQCSSNGSWHSIYSVLFTTSVHNIGFIVHKTFSLTGNLFCSYC